MQNKAMHSVLGLTNSSSLCTQSLSVSTYRKHWPVVKPNAEYQHQCQKRCQQNADRAGLQNTRQHCLRSAGGQQYNKHSSLLVWEPRVRRKLDLTLRATKEKKEVSSEESARLREMEDELRDPKNFLEYFLPRPVRLVFFAGSAASCLIASILSAARLVSDTRFGLQEGSGQTLLVNLVGLAAFTGLFVWDRSAAEQRKERRQKVRQAQIQFGDREVYLNEAGERMSKLKEVNDDWILRRLERWGRKDGMPFVGPAKGAILQDLVRTATPRSAVEVGSLCGYSAILIAQALPPGARLVSMEADWKWALVAKRFLWQARGERGDSGITGKSVDVWWGDARQKLTELPEGSIEFLFLDGLPSQYLEYLQAAEPRLAKGATIVADNAGVFASGGLKSYLEYVRGSPRYASRFVESTLEWRDNVPDGMEVSEFLG